MLNPIPEQHLFEILKTHYGIDAQSIQLLSLGADMNALIYKVKTKHNSYFIKVIQGKDDEAHLAVIRYLHHSNVKEIIFPIFSTDGQLLKQFNTFKIIVYPFIEGQNGFMQKLTKRQWIELGKTLKNIHTLSLPAPIQKQLRKETFSPKWREIVKTLDLQIVCNTSDNKVTSEFKNFYKSNLNIISRLVNSAEELCKKIHLDTGDYVLCHSDIHAGNILLTLDGSFYIIDWDDPMMAPKERDLMFIGGGVGNVWNSPEEVNYFYEGYGKVNIDRTTLTYYRHERIIEDIALYGLDILSSTTSDQSKLTSFNHFISMFEPNGVIDIAFSEIS